jgi:putative transcriptional regulator
VTGRVAGAFVALCLWMTAVPPVQGPLGRTPPGEVKALAPGKFLVASRALRDPNFAETVVLLTDYDQDGAAGLVVNVRTDVSLARVFDDLSLGANTVSTAFAGGPVARTSAIVLIRSRPGITGVRSVVPGVDLVATRDRLEQTLTSEIDPTRFRVYLGRAGWAPEQLERETLAGAWHVVPAETDLVFDPEPTTVWRRLIRRTEMLQANTTRPAVRPRRT